MENNAIVIIITAFSTLIASLGLPAFYKNYFGRTSFKEERLNRRDKEIQDLKMRMAEIVTAVDMLLIVIKDHYNDNPAIQEAISKVEQHLHNANNGD